MTGWLPPEDFAKVVASRAGFKEQLKQLSNAELIRAFTSNVESAKREIAKLRRDIAQCMPGDFALNGDKDTPGLNYLLMKAACAARGWKEYLAWARTGQEQATPVKREPIAPRSWVEPREPGSDDDEELAF